MELIKDKKKDKDAQEEKRKTNLEILPHRYYDDEHECFIMEDKSCFDLLSIIPRDIENMADDELHMEVYQQEKNYKLIGEDLKFISMKFPINCSCQKNILKHHRDKATDEIRLKWINRQIEEIETIENNIHSSKFYLFYFGKDLKEFLKTRETLNKYLCLGLDKLCETVESYQKIQIVNQICNMNYVFDLHYFDSLESEDIDEEETEE